MLKCSFSKRMNGVFIVVSTAVSISYSFAYIWFLLVSFNLIPQTVRLMHSEDLCDVMVL